MVTGDLVTKKRGKKVGIIDFIDTINNKAFVRWDCPRTGETEDWADMDNLKLAGK